MESNELRRLLLVATIVALSLTALIAIVALLAADFGETALRILATTAGFGVSLIAMRGTVLLDQRRRQTDPPSIGPIVWASGTCARERDERVTRIEFGVG